jgi:hypothetical protein
MDIEVLHEVVKEAVASALHEHDGGAEYALASRMMDGRIVFIDGEDRTVKEIPVSGLFKKVTSIREKLRVLEQKINNAGDLGASEKAALQAYVTRAYGSLTTFNFLFADETDRFRGTGS